MKTRSPRAARAKRVIARLRKWRVPALKAVGAATLVLGVAGSAILAKESGKRPVPLASLSLPEAGGVPIMPVRLVTLGEPRAEAAPTHGEGAWSQADLPPKPEATSEGAQKPDPARADEPGPRLPAGVYSTDPNVRWFNGRPVRPARVMEMVVTAYSPDWRSCGDSADGKTATLHSVETNGHALVAADPKVLPYGSMLTIPGYDNGRIVPVLDCGGAIKGRRLDVLYPTHERARRWGRQKLQVIVWEYADGAPRENPRKER
ncbi:MAG: 3D domain-containing protein [Planctomycetota bacterium]|nr:3D domain-containing protein [Planctomycetota bacterium]